MFKSIESVDGLRFQKNENYSMLYMVRPNKKNTCV